MNFISVLLKSYQREIDNGTRLELEDALPFPAMFVDISGKRHDIILRNLILDCRRVGIELQWTPSEMGVICLCRGQKAVIVGFVLLVISGQEVCLERQITDIIKSVFRFCKNGIVVQTCTFGKFYGISLPYVYHDLCCSTDECRIKNDVPVFLVTAELHCSTAVNLCDCIHKEKGWSCRDIKSRHMDIQCLLHAVSKCV